MKFAILLCTYNGERFIREQLDSLLLQSHVHWSCYIFDDRSTDGTADIVKKYALRYPDKFTVTVNEVQSGSAARNFIAATSYALENFQFDCLCYCDQDDVWLPRKLEALALEFKNLPLNEPVAVFSDLLIVDSKLKQIRRSFVEYISVGRDASKHIAAGFLGVDNIVPGCAMACNTALLRRAVPIPTYSLMHDWWLALMAQKAGHLIFLPEALVLYRQHDSNSVGAKDIGLRQKLARIPKILRKLSRIIQMHRGLRSDENALVLCAKYAYVKLYKFFCYR